MAVKPVPLGNLVSQEISRSLGLSLAYCKLGAWMHLYTPQPRSTLGQNFLFWGKLLPCHIYIGLDN